MDKQKNTIFGLILVGLCCMAFAWIFEMLFFTNLGVDISDQDAEAVLESVRRTRSFTAIFYSLGVIIILAGAVRVVRFHVTVFDTGE